MIGYFGLARETFDIPLAKKKFLQAKKLLSSLDPNIKGIDKLVINEESSKKLI